MLLHKPHCGTTWHRNHHANLQHHVTRVRTMIGQQQLSGQHRHLLAHWQRSINLVCSAASGDEGNNHVQGTTAAPAAEIDEVAVETQARLGWDPSGLLPSLDKLGSTDHFARRARQKQQQQQQQAGSDGQEQPPPAAAAAAGLPAQAYSQAVRADQQQQQQHNPTPPPQQQQQQPSAAGPATLPAAAPAAAVEATQAAPAPAAAAAASPAAVFASDPFERIPAKWLSQGGIPASDTTAYDRPAFLAKLAEKFIPVNLDFPGLRILNFDPAVFTVEGFMTADECHSWQQHALESGCLQQSKIGGGNAATSGGANTYGSRRTSSSLLMDPQTQAKSPGLTAMMRIMQSRGHQLLAHLDSGRSWGQPGRMPAPGQYCYESPQVARYTSGQHFLAHEDGFPALLATANGFQRHATLLLYLNDVQQGGATHFDHLGMSVQPKQGMALLFFPSYANGTSDPRSLHTAQDAVDTKWVMQQWIARGYPVPKAVLKAVKVAALAGPEAPAARGVAAAEPVKEVFKVAVSSSSSSSGASAGGGSKKSRKGGKKSGGGKKGFTRR